MQSAAAGFFLGRYANKLDVLKLGWLPINERRENHLLYTVFKALYFNNWPSYLKLGTFQDSASKVFNILPSTANNSAVFNDFKTL